VQVHSYAKSRGIGADEAGESAEPGAGDCGHQAVRVHLRGAVRAADPDARPAAG